METFKILNDTISFEEDLPKCANIYSKKQNCIDSFTRQYNNEKISIVNNAKELLAYMEKMLNVINKGIEDTTNVVLNILVENQILDKSNKDIKMSCQEALQQCNQYVKSIISEIDEMGHISENTLNDIKMQSARIADNSVEGAYIGVISSSVWDLCVTDYMNLKEEERVNRKKEKIYNQNVNAGYIELQKLEKDFAQEEQEKVQKDLYKYGILTIEGIFIYCIETLIEENKIPSSVVNSLQKQKSLTILQNIDRVLDKNVIREQLIVAFKDYPFSKEVHTKILKHITNDIEEYIRLVKFLKCENVIVNICIENCCDNWNQESEKYIKIVKLLEDNTYLQKFIENLPISENNDIAQDIQNSQKLFNELKNIFSEDNTTILQKEKNNFKSIIKRIETTYNAIYNYSLEDLNYENLNNFFIKSKQDYIMKNLKKEKRKKRRKLTFWILFAIWIFLLAIAKTPIDEIIYFGTLPILFIYGVIKFFAWSIKEIYKQIKENQKK